MSYDPFIQRILIEQIQEFEKLDVNDLTQDDDKLNLVSFDIITKKFFWFQYDLQGGTGNIIINNNATLTTNHTVATDDLSVPRGFIFRSGWTMNQVVNALCNPPAPGILTLNATPRFAEISTRTTINITYTWVQNSEGTIIPPDSYYRGSVFLGENSNASIFDNLYSSTVGDIVYKVDVNLASTTQYPASMKSATDNVEVVYPFLVGTNTDGSLPGTLVGAKRMTLADAPKDGYMILDWDGLVPYPPGSIMPSNFYWFATSANIADPIDYVFVNDSTDSGSIEILFDKHPTKLNYKENLYNIWITDQLTYFSDKLRINF